MKVCLAVASASYCKNALTISISPGKEYFMGIKDLSWVGLRVRKGGRLWDENMKAYQCTESTILTAKVLKNGKLIEVSKCRWQTLGTLQKSKE